jgi:GMP synthase (glutamine-hydrolysing)
VAVKVSKTTAEEKEILIIKNVTREGPGILGDLISELGIASRIIDLSVGETPGDHSGYGAVIVLGGPDSANDQTSKMKDELGFISRVLDKGIPYLGICLGMQTLVKAAGGSVIKCQVSETGFREMNGDLYKVVLTQDGINDPLFQGLDDSFTVFQLHGETVSLTSKMILLAEGRSCRDQIVKMGRSAYGMQCHFELTEEMFESWIKDDGDLQMIDTQQLRNDFSLLKNDYYSNGRKLFTNFLRLAGYHI